MPFCLSACPAISPEEGPPMSVALDRVAPSGRDRRNFASLPEVLPLPNLIETQLVSFKWFCEEGLAELFAEISPIQDFTGKNLDLKFISSEYREPKYSEEECRTKDLTYSKPLWARVELVNKETGEVTEQDVFLGDFPWMTDKGTFVINGAERVVVSQLVRSPGVYFTAVDDPTTGRRLFYGKLIPNRGAWLEFETSNKDVISVKVDRKRKLTVTTLLRAIGYSSNEEIAALFTAVDLDPEHQYIQSTLEKDPTTNTNEGLVEVYKRLRPGDPPTIDNARSLVQSLFFNFRRYDLAKVGRYKLNRKLGLDLPARRAHPQASPLGARTGGSLARARGLRRPRRALQPLRPDLPDRDPGRSEHRPHRVARDLRSREPVRLHRVAVPPGRSRRWQ